MPLAGEAYLAIGEIAGRAAAARILARRAADARRHRGGRRRRDRDGRRDRLRPRVRFAAGAPPPPARRAVLAEQTLAVPADERSALGARARRSHARRSTRLPWTKALTQWRDRVMFPAPRRGRSLARPLGRGLAAAPDWLAPFLLGKTRLDEIGADDLVRGAARPAALGARAPARRRGADPFRGADRHGGADRLRGRGRPAIALRVQELFGLDEHPALAGGRIPLTLHLLSPAHRPIQITRDLPGFWRGSWAAVRSDLRGRYPRHFWPEDPASAAPTTRAKPRGT